MTEVEVRSGALQIQKATGLGKKFQKKYAALYRRSHHGVSRLEVYDNKESFEKRAKKQVISLDSCLKIERTTAPDSKKHEIKLMLNDNKEQVFLTDTEEDKELWYGALSNVIFGGNSLTENVIYEQYEEEGYDVVLRQNEIVQKLNLSGLYRLVITETNVELRDKTSKKVAAHWPLMLLRKYGRDKQEFSLEAGRRCQTGPGMFFFMTDHYNEIFQDVDAKVRSLAQRNRAQSTSSIKSRKSPTFTNPPESPVPPSPLPLAPEGEYADPRDQLLSPRKPITEEPVYNEPVNTKPKSKPAQKEKKPSTQVLGPPKPERVKKGAAAGKKKDKKSKPPPIVEEATYSEPALVGRKLDADDGGYGSLNFDGKPAAGFGSRPTSGENQYDSLNVGWNESNVAESEYSTTTTLTENVTEDGVYDHVKH